MEGLRDSRSEGSRKPVAAVSAEDGAAEPAGARADGRVGQAEGRGGVEAVDGGAVERGGKLIEDAMVEVAGQGREGGEVGAGNGFAVGGGLVEGALVGVAKGQGGVERGAERGVGGEGGLIAVGCLVFARRRGGQGYEGGDAVHRYDLGRDGGEEIELPAFADEAVAEGVRPVAGRRGGEGEAGVQVLVAVSAGARDGEEGGERGGGNVLAQGGAKAGGARDCVGGVGGGGGDVEGDGFGSGAVGGVEAREAGEEVDTATGEGGDGFVADGREVAGVAGVEERGVEGLPARAGECERGGFGVGQAGSAEQRERGRGAESGKAGRAERGAIEAAAEIFGGNVVDAELRLGWGRAFNVKRGRGAVGPTLQEKRAGIERQIAQKRCVRQQEGCGDHCGLDGGAGRGLGVDAVGGQDDVAGEEVERAGVEGCADLYERRPGGEEEEAAGKIAADFEGAVGAGNGVADESGALDELDAGVWDGRAQRGGDAAVHDYGVGGRGEGEEQEEGAAVHLLRIDGRQLVSRDGRIADFRTCGGVFPLIARRP